MLILMLLSWSFLIENIISQGFHVCSNPHEFCPCLHFTGELFENLYTFFPYHWFLSAMLLSFMSLVVGCAGEMNPTFLAEQILFLNWVNWAGFSVI